MSEETHVVRAGSQPGGSGPAVLPALAIKPVLAIAVVLTGLLIAFSDRYGYHRDELTSSSAASTWPGVIRISRRSCRWSPG